MKSIGTDKFAFEGKPVRLSSARRRNRKVDSEALPPFHGSRSAAECWQALLDDPRAERMRSLPQPLRRHAAARPNSSTLTESGLPQGRHLPRRGLVPRGTRALAVVRRHLADRARRAWLLKHHSTPLSEGDRKETVRAAKRRSLARPAPLGVPDRGGIAPPPGQDRPC